MKTFVSGFLLFALLISFPACDRDRADRQPESARPEHAQAPSSGEAAQSLSDGVVYMDDMSVEEMSRAIRGKVFQANDWDIGAGIGEVLYFAPTGNEYYWFCSSMDAQARIRAEYGVWELDNRFMTLTAQRMVEHVGGRFAASSGSVASKYTLEDYDEIVTEVSLESKMNVRMFQYSPYGLGASGKEPGFRVRSVFYYHASGLGGIERLRYNYESWFSLLESKEGIPAGEDIDGALYQPDNPEEFFVYYRGAESSFDDPIYPVAWQVAQTLDGNALFDIFATYSSRMKQQRSLGESIELSVSGGTAQVNMSVSPPSVDTVITMAETLLRGSREVNAVRFFVDSMPYSIEGYSDQIVYITDQEGMYAAPSSMKLPPKSMEEMAAIRGSIPYAEDLQKPDEALLLTYTDKERWREITEFIYSVHCNNDSTPTFATIKEAPPEFILSAALWNTGWVDAKALFTTGYSQSCKTKEHVEHTAALLFGEDVSVAPSALTFIWEYNPYTGTYGHSATGIYGDRVPVILDYEVSDTLYNVTAVFLSANINLEWTDENQSLLAEQEVEAWCKTKAQKYQILLERQPDGTLRYLSCLEAN